MLDLEERSSLVISTLRLGLGLLLRGLLGSRLQLLHGGLVRCITITIGRLGGGLLALGWRGLLGSGLRRSGVSHDFSLEEVQGHTSGRRGLETRHRSELLQVRLF